MNLKIVSIAFLAIVSGCHSLTVENYGDEVVRDEKGAPVVSTNGIAQTVGKGWKLHRWGHWTDESINDFSASIENGKIGVGIGKFDRNTSSNLVPFVQATLSGVAELAAKVGTAIATCGGKTAGDAGAAAISALIQRFITKGGDAANATVTCKDGSCTISDGTVSEDCPNCYVK